MTVLVSWAGVDSRGPASLYLASDSRMSWPDKSCWDYGRKLFASQVTPDVLGYSGDAFPPTQVLSQITSRLDAGAFFQGNESCDTRAELIAAFIADSMSSYPPPHRGEFQVLYGTRVGEGNRATFFAYRIDFRGGSTRTQQATMPIESNVLCVVGSGRNAMEKRLAAWQISDVGRTSRAVFGALCDTIAGNEDPRVGGAPQLVSLYRKGPARTIGVSFEGRGFVDGAAANPASSREPYEWRNSRFERLDSASLELLAGSQRQPRPRQV